LEIVKDKLLQAEIFDIRLDKAQLELRFDTRREEVSEYGEIETVVSQPGGFDPTDMELFVGKIIPFGPVDCYARSVDSNIIAQNVGS
jgi:hypothetical protein